MGLLQQFGVKPVREPERGRSRWLSGRALQRTQIQLNLREFWILLYGLLYRLLYGVLYGLLYSLGG
jgi:hypothetical protein